MAIETKKKTKSIKGKVIGVLLVIGLLVGAIGFNSLVGSVDAREYHVKQAAVTGDLSVHAKPGWYGKMLGNIEEYPRTYTFYFSKDDLDGGDDAAAQALKATFMGNSTADVSGMVKVILPTAHEKQIALHRDYGSIEGVSMDLIRNTVASALKQTGPMFRPEEAFTTRRPEFTQIMRDILDNGIPATETVVDSIVEGVGDSKKVIRLSKSVLKRDSLGQLIITTESTLKKYGITITQFDIKEFDFDAKTDQLIKKKKEAEQEIVAAKAKAEKAKQDALTAEEDGKARVAKAEADALVEKKTAVVAAEREAAVAEQNKIKAQLDADALLATKRAEAEAARLKVKAGLTPQEKAEWDFKTSVGVAEHLSKVNMPELMVIGGGKGGSNNLNPFDAIGLESFHNLSKKMSKQ
jgi:regulator of protease activity HflC (stomatin/prohibitin superfamily)